MVLHTTRKITGPIVLLMLFASACGILGPDYERVIGALTINPDHGTWDLPTQVPAGSSFMVTVLTEGSNGCWRSDDTEVRREADVVTITPYDLRPTGDRACPSVVVTFEHTARIDADEPGTLTLLLRGRSADGIVTLEHEVAVVEE